MFVELDLKKVVEAVRKLAKESPKNQYVYSPCQYTQGFCTNGSTGCIIGQALMNLGYEETLWEIDKVANEMNFLATYTEGYFEFDPSSKEFEWLEEVQSHQDSRVDWGSCIEMADDQHPLK